MRALSRITFVPYVLAFKFPLKMVSSAGTNKISKYVIFPPPVVILTAPLQGINGRGVSLTSYHISISVRPASAAQDRSPRRTSCAKDGY